MRGGGRRWLVPRTRAADSRGRSPPRGRGATTRQQQTEPKVGHPVELRFSLLLPHVERVNETPGFLPVREGICQAAARPPHASKPAAW
eukprot:scaffold39321_cov59-Phaeocystis_antarctica.AAC.2